LSRRRGDAKSGDGSDTGAKKSAGTAASNGSDGRSYGSHPCGGADCLACLVVPLMQPRLSCQGIGMSFENDLIEFERNATAASEVASGLSI
jgi:hypothetical protein